MTKTELENRPMVKRNDENDERQEAIYEIRTSPPRVSLHFSFARAFEYGTHYTCKPRLHVQPNRSGCIFAYIMTHKKTVQVRTLVPSSYPKKLLLPH